MSGKRPGAGSRMEHEDLDRHIFSAPVVGESAVLQRIRGHVDLQVMSRAARRGRCFTNVFAVLLVTLRTQLVDVLFSFLRNSSEREAGVRHSGIISAVSIMEEVCTHIQELRAWGYSLEQLELVQDRFKTLSGWGRCLHRRRIGADTLSLSWAGGSSRATSDNSEATAREGRGSGLREQALRQRQQQRQGKEIETPFLLAFLFALQSKALPLLPLACTLGKASKGAWNPERTILWWRQRGSLVCQWIRLGNWRRRRWRALAW